METYEFTIVASGLDPHSSDFADRFYEAGCDDATISLQKGAIILDFDREASSFSDAIDSAIKNVRDAGAIVERVEPDHLVSLSDIAKRSGLSRAAVSLYASGERGENFPIPVSRVTTESPLWDWSIVSEWLLEKGTISKGAVEEARFIKEINHGISAARFAIRHKVAA